MQFLKALFWILLGVLAAFFALRNWTPVQVNLWQGLVLETRLPVLLLFAFLIGLVPTLLLHRATRWRLTRRIGTMEKAIADARPVTPPATAQPAGVPLAKPATPPISP